MLRNIYVFQLRSVTSAPPTCFDNETIVLKGISNNGTDSAGEGLQPSLTLGIHSDRAEVSLPVQIKLRLSQALLCAYANRRYVRIRDRMPLRS